MIMSMMSSVQYRSLLVSGLLKSIAFREGRKLSEPVLG